MFFYILCFVSLHFINGKVVTLGDSFASGLGISARNSDYHDQSCWREIENIPGARYASLVGKESEVVACVGAEIFDVGDQIDSMNQDYLEDVSNSWSGSVILVSVGGNDARTRAGFKWTAVIQDCIINSSCHENRENDFSNSEEVKKKLISLYTKLANTASMARVRILGYPLLFNPTWFCFTFSISLAEARYVDQLVRQMNGVILDAVTEVKSSFPNFDIEFIDVTQYFRNGVCAFWSSREINGAFPTAITLAPAAFHPSRRGYDRYYEAMLDNLF